MIDRNEVVPISSGVMTCKILCLDNSSARKRYSRLRLKSNLNRGEEGAAVAMAKREKNQEKKGNERETVRNDTGKQSLRTPSRYSDKDDSKQEYTVEEDSFEEDDNYQSAPVQNTNHSNNISRNGSTEYRNENRDSGKSIPSKKINTNTVDNLLDNDDAPLADNSSSKKNTVTAPITPISRPPAAVVDRPSPAATPKQFVAPAPVEQAADMFHFEGLYFSDCFIFSISITLLAFLFYSLYSRLPSANSLWLINHSFRIFS